MTLKRKGSALLAMLALVCAGTSASADEMDWRLTHFAPKTSAFYTVMTGPFLTRMEEVLGKEIRITGFGGGELAPGLQAYQAVQDGVADISHSTPLYLVNKDFANSFIGGHPGGMNADMMLYWLYEAGGQALATAFKRETMQLHSLVVGCLTAEIWHSHKPLRTAADLKGLKFRTAGAWATLLKEKFAAAPVVVSGSELYSLFERKGVDALEWSGASENLAMGFANIGEYVTVPAPHLKSGCFELAWRSKDWDALPPEVRSKITAIAKLATIDSLLKWKRMEIEAFGKLSKNAKVVHPAPELVAAINEAGRSYVYGLIEKGQDKSGWLKKMADSYYAAMDGYAIAAPVLSE